MAGAIISLVIGYFVTYYMEPFLNNAVLYYESKGIDAVEAARMCDKIQFLVLLSVTVLVYFIIFVIKWLMHWDK